MQIVNISMAVFCAGSHAVYAGHAPFAFESVKASARQRPEASKGESTIGFLLYDADSDLRTTHDQSLVGGGPSRADPMDMGTIVTYAGVDPWRSIFDSDDADRVVPYQVDCAAADKRMQETRTP